MEKIQDWRERAKAEHCAGSECIIECPYYEGNGRIKGEQVIEEFIDRTEILELED